MTHLTKLVPAIATPVPAQQPTVLPSDHINNDALVVSHGRTWSTPSQPRPRFADPTWAVTGLDPVPRAQRNLNFADLPTPEWALYAREISYYRLNQRLARHLVPAEQNQATRSGTLMSLLWRLRCIAEHAETLNIGLPHEWLHSDTERLSERIQQHHHDRQFGTVVRWLHEMRHGLTLGGLGFDPTLDVGVAAWSGDLASRPIVTGTALSPQVFHAVVANALFYIDTAAQDILNGRRWLNEQQAKPAISRRTGGLRADDPARTERSDVRTPYVKAVHEIVEAIGGIPVRTATNFRGNSTLAPGTVALSTLHLLMSKKGESKPPSGAKDPVWAYLRNRADEGTPNVQGGLPIPIREGLRPDGSTGPWRIGFCPDGLLLEAAALREACWVIILAFTGMRAGEVELLPAHDWLTTWHGTDAVTTNLIKGANGEPLKWWANSAVVTACSILEQLTYADARYLGDSTYRRGSGPGTKTRLGARVYYDLQHFIQHVETDSALQGFLSVEAGWKTNRGYYGRLTPEQAELAERATTSPHNFRFTLASIASVVGLGDVAFQKQAKHAAMNITHAYMTNNSSPDWLNVLVNAEAVQRANRAFDFFVDTWTGSGQLQGAGGRQAQRVIRGLLANLPITAYDPDAEDSAVEQFATQVRDTPELVSALRATATTIHLGDLVHCWRNPLKQECADFSALPVLGLCRPETCQNVLIDEQQAPLWRQRHAQVVEQLVSHRLPPQQRIVLDQRRLHLERQLGRESDGS